MPGEGEMKVAFIKYRGGYKYQLIEPYAVTVAIKPPFDICHDYISLSTNGVLTINGGYAWDGPSGPTVDTKNFMRGSLVHDALYQLMREGHLSQECRKIVDEELRRICREDGMSSIRAWWVYRGVRFGGENSAERQPEVVLTAP
jgi:hypothetical protein